MFKTAILAATTAASLAATPASAYVLRCVIFDTAGQTNTYVFATNTETSMVEVAYSNGTKDVSSHVGNRPVWRISYPRGNDLVLNSQDAPRWFIVSGHHVAALIHNRSVVGRGSCAWQSEEGEDDEEDAGGAIHDMGSD
jgi:hypothetical protein